ncbi:hypothetical protein C21_03757 [Arenibacter sp. NBRC 103722]|uniref:PepSY-like domain-containing protein n=1 Tax=Arenibacter sp. NBRC 103722 TaxID=1113929 RepID=UPI000852B97E|nr:PepSY-like domain-containing protein [Arenibacter sp. NBRC 103722]MDX1766418.1 PepSY-like domain-containing protein [Arenibacter troitsensis]GBF21571.1 hypothetical protein C21_03757 [Arenibacter sp. NBRC 103722]
MKTLNNLSILALIGLAFLGSCSKNASPTDGQLALAGITALADTKITSTDLPQIVQDYVATNYPNSTVSKSEMEDNGNFEVKLNNGDELIFGADGAFIGVDDDINEDFGDIALDATALPQSVLDYVKANFIGLTIISASMENNGHYEVALSDSTELVFDSDGVFLGVGVDENEAQGDENDSDDVSMYGDDQNGVQHEDGTVIDAAILPQLAKDFLSTTYPSASIVEARSTPNGSFEVELSNKIEVIFDTNGSFVNSEDGSREDGD